MSQQGVRTFLGRWSLRAHLLALCVLATAPLILLAGILLLRLAEQQRADLESRVVQTADGLADDIDREIERSFTVLRTLARLPSLTGADWPAFYTQARAVLDEEVYVIVIDRSLRQLVNTRVPFGQAPAVTGDPETALSVIESKRPAVSNLFLSLIDGKPVFNLDLPIVEQDEVTHILLWGRLTETLGKILKGAALGRDWTATLVDRNQVVMATSREDQSDVGSKAVSAFSDRMVQKSAGVDGISIMQASSQSKMTGWRVTASVPVEVAEAPIRRTLWTWGIGSLLILAASVGSGWLFARLLSGQMGEVAQLARALSRQEKIAAPPTSISEVDTIERALRDAAAELESRAAHQQMLLHELSHRVKNVLMVVQAIVMRTLTNERPARESRDLLLNRIHALGRAHEMLMRSDWKGAPMAEIVKNELTPFLARVEIDGPPVIVEGRMVQTLSLVIHELATNAAKYGSLSNQEGRVMVSWSISGDGSTDGFTFCWEERDGPHVAAPTRSGFGSALLGAAFSAEPRIKPRFEFRSGGFVYWFDAPLQAVSST
jgi:two-component sensor histidine kinase